MVNRWTGWSQSSCLTSVQRSINYLLACRKLFPSDTPIISVETYGIRLKILSMMDKTSYCAVRSSLAGSALYLRPESG